MECRVQEPQPISANWPWLSSLGKGLFLLLGYLAVFGCVALSMWAVVQVQLDSRPAGDPVRYFYTALFIICELWVAVGVILMMRRLKEGAFAAAGVALLLWIPAVGLSALQESRFHILNDGAVQSDVAPALAQRDAATARIENLNSQLAVIERPTRAAAAIDAEYQRYADNPRYVTLAARLKAELENAKAYAALNDELATNRQTLIDTAALAASATDAKKVGQSFTVPLLGWEVSSDATVWILIAWMMGIKSFGGWLLFGSAISTERRVTETRRATWFGEIAANIRNALRPSASSAEDTPETAPSKPEKTAEIEQIEDASEAPAPAFLAPNTRYVTRTDRSGKTIRVRMTGTG